MPVTAPTITPELLPADVVATRVYGTLTAQPTATLRPTETLAPTQTPTETVFAPTIPALPTLPAITVTAPPDLVAGGLNIQGKGDYSCLVMSQNPADWTQFKPKNILDATWTVKNVGNKAWNDQVKLVYVGGDKIHTYGDSYDLAKVVDPGSSISLIVDMITPKTEGVYSVNWGLSAKGNLFCTFYLTLRVFK